MPANTQDSNRRKFLKLSLGLIGAGIVPPTLARQSCKVPTPAQTEGPFYPLAKPSDTDWDLTRTRAHQRLARGTAILVEGIVQDQNCLPVGNAVVEIWQACASGRYNHPGDNSQNPLDPDFQYWGITKTDPKGHYFFQTIVPGHYAVTNSWTRPPHIHFKVHQRGFQELTTQLYFQGHPLNADDLILQRVPESKRVQVVRPLMPINPKSIPSIPLIAQNRIVFDVQIERI